MNRLKVLESFLLVISSLGLVSCLSVNKLHEKEDVDFSALEYKQYGVEVKPKPKPINDYNPNPNPNPLTTVRHIHSDTVNVKRNSSQGSSVIFQLHKGDKVEVEIGGGVKNGYSEIYKDGVHQGYVLTKSLHTKKPKGIENKKRRITYKDHIEICRAGISTIFGRPLKIIRAKKRNQIVHLSYKRSDDRKVFKNVCKVKGNRVMWAAVFSGTGQGRWRNHASDSKISFTIRGNNLIVTERYTDNSSTTKSFKFSEF